MSPMRPALLLTLLGALALAAATSCSDGGSSTPEELPAGLAGRPHVVVISLDTLRADHLGCYGYERDTSPKIDLFAKGSVVFERCTSTAPWTLVSHMSLLTGLYPGQHRVISEKNALAAGNPTLAERFQAAGYETASFHSEGWIHERYGFARGFDIAREHVGAYEARDNVDEFMAQRDEERPLFLFIHLFDVHSAAMGEKDKLVYQPPKPYRRLFHEAPEDLFEPGDALGMWYDSEKPTPEQVEALVALYDGGVRFVDDIVGAWLSGWHRDGWLQDAAIVITSDHGETLAQRGGIMRGHGGLYNDGLHIPLILRLPGAERAGERVARPVNQVDIAPTLLELAGLEVEAFLPGIDLLSGEERDADHVMEARWGPDEAYLQWPLKVVQSTVEFRPQFVADMDRDFAEQDVLDLEADPATYGETLERLRAEFEQQIAALPLPERQPGFVEEALTDVEKDRLEALGYREEAGGSEGEPTPDAGG